MNGAITMKNMKSRVAAGLLLSAGLVLGSAASLTIIQPAVAQDKDQTRACDKDGTCDSTPDQDRTRDQDKLDGTKDQLKDQDKLKDQDQLKDQDKLDGTKDQLKDQDKLHDQDMDKLHDQDMDHAQDQLKTQDHAGSGSSANTPGGNSGSGPDKGNQGPH